ncbi:MAG TPA: dehydrogenase [Planctomycetes bacterium]|nr:dehydrogenase [Fuerstiella sp.]HIK95006.1 dehydrogenase [Planctomycetota bacterium]
MNDIQRATFRVTLTADFYDEAGNSKFDDLGLGVFEDCDRIEATRFGEHRPEITPDQLAGCAGVVVLTPQVTAESLSDSDQLLAIGRFGVGYDSVDVDACTERDVLAMITAGAVDRPVAEATIGWMIALTHHMLAKDRLVRSGQWDDRTQFMGCELRDRTLGVIGLGGIGRKLVSLLQGFGMQQPLVFDPFVPAALLEELGVRSVTLDELLTTADFVSVHCPLNKQTRGLIGAEEIAKMKSDSYLLNTARGGIVDEQALFDALQEKRIAGAALDCFEDEPVTQPHRFGELDNVILAPHSIAWTAELFRDIGRTACQSMLDLSQGKRPAGVLNPELFERTSFRAKWSRITGISEESLG